MSTCYATKEKYNSLLKNWLVKHEELVNIKHKWTEALPARDVDLKVASTINTYIEPTNHCNLDCYFCARQNMKRKPVSLSLDSFKRIIENIPAGAYITLTGNGEPLLNSKIYDMIKLASDKGIMVSIITNGTPLTDKNARKLIESGISRVQFSFDSIDRALYEKIRKGASFSKTLTNILNFMLLVHEEYKTNIFISISSVQTEEVKKIALQNNKFWTKMPINNFYQSPLFSLQTDSAAYIETVREDESWQPCITPFVATKINADGNVISCPQDFSGKYYIGNVNQNTLSEILNSENAIRLRRALFESDQEFLNKIGYRCLSCNTWRKSSGYGINEYLKDNFPIIMGLQVMELNSRPLSSLDFLKEALEYLEKTGDIVELL